MNELPQQTVIVAVPADAVTELQRNGLADPLPVFRGAALDAVVTIGTDSAALVTLLQTPESLKAFAAWVRGRGARSQSSLELSVRRGNQKIEMTVDGNIPIESVAEFLIAAFKDRSGS